MIRHLIAREFKAVPHLETSLLMQAHPEGVKFSQEKPNVVVGPNGAGKSALLKALSLETLTHFTASSSFDDKYTGLDSKELWEQVGGKWWSNEYTFLPGLQCDSDKAPALFYRPGHIPGNYEGVTHAMMCGYFEQARSYGELTDDKSSGQQAQALLENIRGVFEGDFAGLGYGYANWRFGKKPRELERGQHHCDFDYQAETLRQLYGSPATDARPVVLMDEPEQSLDARAEALLWNLIAKVDCSRVQVIVATHSVYPLVHPEKFNLIEAVPGYADEVRALM